MNAAAGWIGQAYVEACRAELAALKPGNVHAFADGHRMTVADFEASAMASAPAMDAAGLAVGARIKLGIERTRDAVGCNTNLGIVLLCAPLAAAAATGALRKALPAVLAGLSGGYADLAFAPIQLAAPAGLGDSAEHDVRQPARVTLLTAMRAAAARDSIARQYATDFEDVFALGLARLAAGRTRWRDPRWATTSAYLGFLGALPDSHVARKHGIAAAEALRRAGSAHDAALLDAADPEQMTTALLEFDATLKSAGINPGTSADLTVASLFAHRLGARFSIPDAADPRR